jgi:hypothetical protein
MNRVILDVAEERDSLAGNRDQIAFGQIGRQFQSAVHRRVR